MWSRVSTASSWSCPPVRRRKNLKSETSFAAVFAIHRGPETIISQVEFASSTVQRIGTAAPLRSLSVLEQASARERSGARLARRIGVSGGFDRAVLHDLPV